MSNAICMMKEKHLVTSKQVARLAGVSRSTVSRTLNGSSHVSDETRQRVLAAVATLSYEPDVVGQSLVRQRSHVLALGFFADASMALSQLGQPEYYFYLQVLQYLEQEAKASGYDLILSSHSPARSVDQYIRSLRTRRIAGTIMIAGPPTDARVSALIKAEIPTVFIDHMGKGPAATYIKSDNVAGSRQIVEHLLHLGHTRIAFLTGQVTDLAGVERLLGAQQIMAHAGLGIAPGLIRQSDWTMESAYQATVALLQERRDFTAIVAGSDMMALGILRALHVFQLRVPEDVSVTGFDDIQLGEYTEPPLTTMHQDAMTMGRESVRLLLTMIEKKEQVAPLVLPTHLVVRSSTGPVPS